MSGALPEKVKAPPSVRGDSHRCADTARSELTSTTRPSVTASFATAMFGLRHATRGGRVEAWLLAYWHMGCCSDACYVCIIRLPAPPVPLQVQWKR